METEFLDLIYTELMLNNTSNNEIMLRETLFNVTSFFSDRIFNHKGIYIKPKVFSIMILDHNTKELQSKSCCGERYTINCIEKCFYRYDNKYYEIKCNHHNVKNKSINKLVRSYYHEIRDVNLYRISEIPIIINTE